MKKLRKIIFGPIFFINSLLWFLVLITALSSNTKDSSLNGQQNAFVSQQTEALPSILPGFAGLPLEPPFHITAEFNDNDYLRTIGFPHTGIDVSKHYGATVYSVFDADVLQIEADKPKQGYIGNTAGSNYVITRTKIGDTYYFVYYWHLDRPTVLPGTYVKKGTAIGIQGNSGYSSGTHLHLEIRISKKPELPNAGRLQNDNTPINPRQVIDFSKNK